MSTRPPGDLDELPRQLAELRELIREAHGVTKDLRAATREARSMIGDMADASAKAAYEASRDEMARWSRHLQAEMNRSARDLNRAIKAARDHIGRALVPKLATFGPDDDKLTITFEGGLFDADVPLLPHPGKTS